MKELVGDGIGSGPIRLSGINLEISSKCNLNCRNCFRKTYIGSGKDLNMDLAAVRHILPEIKHLHSIDLTGWGEPLLHPDFGKILKEIRHDFPGALSFTTNGILMDDNVINYVLEAEVDTVCFSVDACDDESYRAVRGRHWAKIEAAIGTLVKRKKTRGRGIPRIYTSFLLRRSRLMDLYKYGDKMTQLLISGIILQQMTGVFNTDDIEDVSYSGYYGARFKDEEFNKEMKELREEMNYLQILGPEYVGTQPQGGCGIFPLDHLFIKANGDAAPCCVLGYPVLLLNRKRELRPANMLVLGNVRRQTLAEIWDSEAAIEFRKQMVDRGSADVCADCIGLYIRR